MMSSITGTYILKFYNALTCIWVVMCQDGELWEGIGLGIGSRPWRCISACLILEPCANYQTIFSSNQSIPCFISTVKLSELNFSRRVEVELMNVSFSPFFIAVLLEQLNTLVSSADVGFTECTVWLWTQNTQRTVPALRWVTVFFKIGLNKRVPVIRVIYVARCFFFSISEP